MSALYVTEIERGDIDITTEKCDSILICATTVVFLQWSNSVINSKHTWQTDVGILKQNRKLHFHTTSTLSLSEMFWSLSKIKYMFSRAKIFKKMSQSHHWVNQMSNETFLSRTHFTLDDAILQVHLLFIIYHLQCEMLPAVNIKLWYIRQQKEKESFRSTEKHLDNLNVLAILQVSVRKIEPTVTVVKLILILMYFSILLTDRSVNTVISFLLFSCCAPSLRFPLIICLKLAFRFTELRVQNYTLYKGVSDTFSLMYANGSKAGIWYYSIHQFLHRILI